MAFTLPEIMIVMAIFSLLNGLVLRTLPVMGAVYTGFGRRKSLT